MIAENIKKLRRAAKMSQTEFAKRVHVTQGAVSQWENGLTRPDTEQVRIIARELGVSANDILGDITIPAETQIKKDSPRPEEVIDAMQALVDQYGLTPDEAQRVADFVAGLKASHRP